MSEALRFPIFLCVMAAVTYLVRMLPLVCCRKKIRNRFIRSFLYYIPYAVLTVMTVPGIIYSTGYTSTAIVGALVAVILAYLDCSLITVAAGASLAVLVGEMLVPYFSFLNF